MIEMGKHSYGLTNFKVIGGSKVKMNIGKYCSFGDSIVAFVAHNHDSRSISSYPFNHHRVLRKQEINIGNDVFIGSNTVLFGGITIGDGAFIGAFSKITKDVPPYSVVVGDNRIVRLKFSSRDIDFLLKLRWWDFESKKLEKIKPILISNDIEKLKEMYE